MRGTGWNRTAAACDVENTTVAAGLLPGGFRVGRPEAGKAASSRSAWLGCGLALLALICFITAPGCQREGKPSGGEANLAETSGVTEGEKGGPERPGGGAENGVERSDSGRGEATGSGEERPRPGATGEVSGGISGRATSGSDRSVGSEKEKVERPRRTPIAPTFRHPLDEVPEGKLYRQVLQAMDEGNLRPAQEFLSKFAEHPQFGVLAQAVRAQLLAERGDLEEALRIAEQVSAVPILRAESFMIAGDVFRRQGRWGDAINLFQQAQEVHPDHLRAHRWLGALYHDTGAMKLAVDHLRRAADLDPSDYRVLRLSGLIHREYEMFSDAVEDYGEALRRSPPEPIAMEIRVELARAHLALRELDEGLEALAPVPDIPDALVLRAELLETRGEVEEARQLAERALDRDSEHAAGNLVLGRLAIAERDWDRARRHLEQVVAQKPTDHEPRFLLGRALLNSGEEELGRQQLERATELREMFLALAELHLDAMNRPQDVEVRMKLGALAEELGWNRVALTWYEAAWGLDDEREEAREAIERLRGELGKEYGL